MNDMQHKSLLVRKTSVRLSQGELGQFQMQDNRLCRWSALSFARFAIGDFALTWIRRNGGRGGAVFLKVLKAFLKHCAPTGFAFKLGGVS